jgi:hypothetical protein
MLLPPPDIVANYVDEKTGKPSKDFFNWIKSLSDTVRGGAPNIVTGSYTISASDSGSVIVLAGNAFYPLLFPNSAIGDGFFITVINSDVYQAGGRGKHLTAENGDFDFILWPGQSVVVRSIDDGWRVLGRTRWKTTIDTGPITLYVHPVSGNDANDGLAAGAGNALQTINFAITRVAQDQFDLYAQAAPQVLVQLADGTHSGGLHLPGPMVGMAGNATVRVTGNATTPSNVVWAGDSSTRPLSLFDGAILQIENLLLQDSVAPGLVSVESGSILHLLNGVSLGTCAAGGLQMRSWLGGQIINGGSGITVSDSPAGGNGYLFAAQDTGYITFQGATVSFSANVTYNTVALVQQAGRLNLGGVTFNLAGHTVTGKRYASDNAADIMTFGGGPNFIPGTVAGTTSNGGTYF